MKNDGAGWRWRIFDDRHLPWVSFLVATALYSFFGLLRLRLVSQEAFDFAIFDQAVMRYSHFQAPIVTIKGDSFNILGDHFHPIIALWAPLYWIWDNPAMLIIGQAIIVALTVFPLWRVVRRRWSGPLAAVFVGCALSAWPILTMINYNVHEIAFALPLLAWAIEAMERRHIPTLAVSCVLLLLVREDMGAIVASIGVVWLIWSTRGHRRAADWLTGALLIVGGLAAVFVITGLVIPHFNSAGYQYWNFDSFGTGAKSALLGLLKRPWRAIWYLVWPPIKLPAYLLLLAPLLFLPLRSPYALIALPLMAERMLSSREALWYDPANHYNALPWIVLVFAAFDAYSRLPEGWKSRLRARSKTIAKAAIATTLVLAAFVVAADVWISNGDESARRAGLAQIPANTCVAADDRLAAGLTRTNRVSLPGLSQHRQDFYLLDLSLRVVSLPTGVLPSQQAYDKAISLGFTEIWRDGQVVILEAPDYHGPDAASCGSAAS